MDMDKERERDIERERKREREGKREREKEWMKENERLIERNLKGRKREGERSTLLLRNYLHCRAVHYSRFL